MSIDLNLNNYFDWYAFNPCSKDLSVTSRVKALAITIFMSILTAGFFPLMVFVYQLFVMRNVIPFSFFVQKIVEEHFVQNQTEFEKKDLIKGAVRTENFQNLILRVNDHFKDERIKVDSLEIQVQVSREKPPLTISSLESRNDIKDKKVAERERIIQDGRKCCEGMTLFPDPQPLPQLSLEEVFGWPIF